MIKEQDKLIAALPDILGGESFDSLTIVVIDNEMVEITIHKNGDVQVDRHPVCYINGDWHPQP